MTEPDEALLWAMENSPPHIYVELTNAAHAYRAGAAASAERIKALEAENADLQNLAGRLRVEMSDMLTRLKEKYPDEFVGLEDGDEPTSEDAYGWGCQEWGVPR